MIVKPFIFLCFISICSHANPDLSLKREVEHALRKGAKWLVAHQADDGSWSEPDYPALSALALTALYRLPSDHASVVPKQVYQKAENFILTNVKSDGGIYKEKLMNYNTSICLMALIAGKKIKHLATIKNARQYLVSLQKDRGKKEEADSLYDGGIGYGTKDFPDLNNTYYALEALKMSKAVVSDSKNAKLNWNLALEFLQRCQNLPSHNDLDFASGDAENKGGFMYYPGNSKAGDTTLNGKTVHRSYGSMTYAGLLSYIYADLDEDDPRVKAALGWLKKHYTVEENPGLGLQGYYYYLFVMAKSFKILGISEVPVKEKAVNWKQQLAEKLVSLQKGDGSWSNDVGRWWESDPVLTTSYAMLSLVFVL